MVDTSQIGVNQVEGKQKKKKKQVMTMRKKGERKIEVEMVSKTNYRLGFNF